MLCLCARFVVIVDSKDIYAEHAARVLESEDQTIMHILHSGAFGDYTPPDCNVTQQL